MYTGMSHEFLFSQVYASDVLFSLVQSRKKRKINIGDESSVITADLTYWECTLTTQSDTYGI